MVTVSDGERVADAARAEQLLREDQAIVDLINAGQVSRLEADRERDQNERQRIALADKYKTGHVGVELVHVIRQEPIPTYVD